MAATNPVANLSDFEYRELVEHCLVDGQLLFNVEPCDASSLDRGQLPEDLCNHFERNGFPLASNSVSVFTERPSSQWAIVDDKTIYRIQRKYEGVEVCVRRLEFLHQLLALETSEGRNAWHEIKEARGELAGYITDLDRVLEFLQQVYTWSHPNSTLAVRAVGFLFGYNLTVATLNSVAKNIPAQLMVDLVANHVWTQEQGLAYVRQISSEEQRVETLIALAPHLTQPELWKELFRDLLQLDEPKQRAAGLSGLAPFFPASVLPEAIQQAIQFQGENGGDRDQTTALIGIAPYLSEAQQQHVLETVIVTWDPPAQVPVLMALAPSLPANLLQKTIQRVEEQLPAYSEQRPPLAVALLSQLAQRGFTGAAVAKAHAWCDGVDLQFVLAHLIPFLSAPLQQETRDQVVGMVRDRRTTPPLPSKEGRPSELLEVYGVETSLALLPYLPDEDFQLVFQQLLERLPFQDDIDSFPDLSATLSEARHTYVYTELLNLLQNSRRGQFENIVTREQWLAQLIPHLPAKILPQALLVAQELLQEELENAGSFLEQMPDDARHSQWTIGGTAAEFWQALSASFDLTRLSRILPSLVALVRREPHALAPEAAEIVQSIEHDLARLGVLSELAPYLPESAVRQAIALAMQLNVAGYQGALPSDVKKITARALARLARALPEAMQNKAIQVAVEATEAIGSAPDQALALQDIAQQAPHSQIRSILLRAFRAVRAIDDTRAQARFAGSAAPHLPREELASRLPHIVEILDKNFPKVPRNSQANRDAQAEREAVLAPCIPLLAQSGQWQHALALIDERLPEDQIMPLAGITAYLPEGEQYAVFQQTMAEAGKHNKIDEWTEVMVWQAGALPETYLETILNIAQEYASDYVWTRTTARLLPYLSDASRCKIVERIQAQLIAGRTVALESLAAIAANLPTPISEQMRARTLELVQAALEMAQVWHVQDDSLHCQAPAIAQSLKAMERHLAIALMGHALETVRTVQSWPDRIGLMAGLLPYLPDSQRETEARQLLMEVEGVHEALASKTEEYRSSAQIQLLAATIPFLPEVAQPHALDRLKLALSALSTQPSAMVDVRGISGALFSLAGTPRAMLHGFWAECLSELARQQRESYLAGASLLVGVMIALGGRETLNDCNEAVVRVGRWWP